MRLRQGRRYLLILSGLLLPWASGLGGPPPAQEPNLLEGASLSVDRDADGIPDAWAEIREAGFRAFPGSIRIDPEGVLRLFLNGRSVGVETIAPVPVQAGASYRMEGRVRTHGLRDGFPEVQVRWLDATGRLVSVLRLPLPRDESLHSFRLDFGQAPEGALTAIVGLAARGIEVNGTVWFDAPSFLRTPRLILQGLPTGNLIEAGTPAAWSVSLGGMDAGPCRLESWLEDLDGRVRWKEGKDLVLPAGTSLQPITLPPQEAGAYRLKVALSARGREVAGIDLGLGIFAALPASPAALPALQTEDPSSGTGAVGAWVDPARPGARELLDVLLPGALAVRIRTPEGSVAATGWGTRPADLLLRRMSRKGVRCVGVLPAGVEESEVRAAVLRYFGEIEAWALPAAAGEGWDSLLARWKAIEPWTATLPRATRWGLDLSEGSALIPHTGAPFTFALTPDGAQAPEGIESWRMPSCPEIRGSGGLRDFSVPLLHALFSGESTFLGVTEGGLLDASGAARPQLLAWRTLAGLLRETRVLGEIPLSAQSEAWAFRRGGQTCVAAWTRQPLGRVRIELPSAHPIVAVDLMGREEILSPADGRVTLEIGPLPRFFLDLSSGWLKTRSTMRLDRAIRPSRQATEALFHLQNGFETPLEGVLVLTAPPGWRVTPSRMDVSLASKEDRSYPVSLVPASYEVTSGEAPHLLEARVEFPDPALAPLEGAVTLRMEPSVLESRAVRYTKDGGILVTQRVVNRGETAVFCDAFLSVPGRPEVRRSLGRLEKDEVRTVEYLLPAGVLDTAAGGVLVGVRELDGERRFSIAPLP